MCTHTSCPLQLQFLGKESIFQSVHPHCCKCGMYGVKHILVILLFELNNPEVLFLISFKRKQSVLVLLITYTK